jgi:hypothetical protein
MRASAREEESICGRSIPRFKVMTRIPERAVFVIGL